MSGKEFQVEGSVYTKASRWKAAWPILGTDGKPMRLEHRRPEKGKREVTLALTSEKGPVMLGLQGLGASLDYPLRVLGVKDFRQETDITQFKFQKTPFAAVQRKGLKWTHTETPGPCHSPCEAMAVAPTRPTAMEMQTVRFRTYFEKGTQAC